MSGHSAHHHDHDHGDDHAHLHRRHDHAWHLADGTGLHAPPATLVRDPDTDRLCCHLCGEYFISLGAHVRTHGHTSTTYRLAMGLSKTVPLTTKSLSNAISIRQARAYDNTPSQRDDLAHGRALAARGTLTLLAKAGRRDVRPQTMAMWRAALDAGRITQSQRRRRDLRERLAGLGFSDLHAYLRHAYGAGHSLESLARSTGLGRSRLRDALLEAGVRIRPVGSNTSQRPRGGRR